MPKARSPERRREIEAAVIQWMDNRITRQQLAESLGISLGYVDLILCRERERRIDVKALQEARIGLRPADLEKSA